MINWSDFKDEYFVEGELAVAERIPHRCSVCTDVPQVPFASVCGHMVCSACVIKAGELPVAEAKTCFLCRGKAPRWSDAFSVAVQIKALKIRCPRAPECKWTGTYGDFVEHCNAKCEQRMIVCTNYGCTEWYTPATREQHEKWCWNEREVECPNCDMMLTCQALENTHSLYCPGAEVTCGDCNGKVKRGDLEDHARECPEVHVTCDKCNGYPVKRKDLARHKETCPNEEILCPCGHTLLRRDLDAHDKNPEFALRHLEVTRRIAEKERDRAEEAQKKLRAAEREIK